LGLWTVAVENGVPTRLNYGENAYGVTVSSTAENLAYSQRRSDTNIWRASGPEADEPSPPARLIGSTREDYGPRYSPDGGRIALTSDRSGENQIWICHNDGSHCYQLTPNGANAAGAYWSPGGESIAFTEMSRGQADVYIADVNMGIPFRLTRDESIDLAGSWSADGQWVYFSSDRTGRYEVWRAPASGGEVEQITYNGGILPVVSSDDRFVYYVKITSPRSVWRIDLESQIERLICEADIEVRGFSIWNSLIIYLLQDSEEGARIEAFDMETRETHTVAELGMETRFGPYGRHSLSPDGHWILFTRQDGGGADIVLVDPIH
jgi:Tol biopolymer transport system component